MWVERLEEARGVENRRRWLCACIADIARQDSLDCFAYNRGRDGIDVLALGEYSAARVALRDDNLYGEALRRASGFIDGLWCRRRRIAHIAQGRHAQEAVQFLRPDMPCDQRLMQRHQLSIADGKALRFVFFTGDARTFCWKPAVEPT